MRKDDKLIEDIHVAILGTPDGKIKGIRHEIDTMSLFIKQTAKIALEANDRSKANDKSIFKRTVQISSIGGFITFIGIVVGIGWKFF